MLPVLIDEENEISSVFDPSDLSSFISENFTLIYSPSFYIEKPKKIKFGINYRNGLNKYSRLVSFEVINSTFSSNLLNDSYEYNLGIEHVKYDKVFRAGLSYKESSFKSYYFSPLTIFSFGSSKKINNLIFDIAASYSYQKYQYHDLFPVIGDSRPDFDSVHESNWMMITSISYQF